MLMSHNVTKCPLNRGRRQMLVARLAAGEKKGEIAKALGVSRRTLSRWLVNDREIEAEVEAASTRLYEDVLDEMREIAFAKTRISSATKWNALERIANQYEEKMQREAGTLSMDQAQELLLKVVEILDDHPEAQAKLIKVYERSRSDIDNQGW